MKTARLAMLVSCAVCAVGPIVALHAEPAQARSTQAVVVEAPQKADAHAADLQPHAPMSSQDPGIRRVLRTMFVSMPRQTTTFAEGQCVGHGGTLETSCYLPGSPPVISLQLGSLYDDPMMSGKLIGHEECHGTDSTLMPDREAWTPWRQRFESIFGFKQWVPWSGAQIPYNQRFEEAWADFCGTCAWFGTTSLGPVKTSYKFVATAKQFNQICRLVKRVTRSTTLFVQPRHRPTRPIPVNYNQNPNCGSRNFQYLNCEDDEYTGPKTKG